jgi:hypothetical protein
LGSPVGTSQAGRSDKVFEIINNVLQRTLGDQATQLFYDSLERRFSLKRCKISDNIDLFTEGLEDCLNEAALPIENKILNDILSACGFENRLTFQIAVPEECDSDVQVRVVTSST